MGELETVTEVLCRPGRWDYAPALEGRGIVSFAERYGLFIGGELVDPRSR